jgi:hypothetical protein
MSKKISRKQVDIDLSNGATNSNLPFQDLNFNLGITNLDTPETFVEKILLGLEAIFPPKPLNLLDVSLTFQNGQNLFISNGSTPQQVSNVYFEGSDISIQTSSYFGSGNSGILSLVYQLNDPFQQSFSPPIILGNDPNISSFTGQAIDLRIVDDRLSGNYWREIFCEILLRYNLIIGISPSQSPYTIQLNHSQTGTSYGIFYINSSVKPIITQNSITFLQSGLISGVPCAIENDIVTVNFNLQNAINEFFNNNLIQIIDSSGNLINSNYNWFDLNVNSPVIGHNISNGIIQTSVKENIYSETVSFNLISDFPGTDILIPDTNNILINLSNFRIDDNGFKSILLEENKRILIGNNPNGNPDYSDYGINWGLQYNSSAHENSLLNSGYEYELQLIGKNSFPYYEYIYPLNNYSSFEHTPTSTFGPDYSSNTGYRYLCYVFDFSNTFDSDTIDSFDIEIVSPNNNFNLSNIESGDIKLYYKIVSDTSETVWINLNKNVELSLFDSGNPFMVGYNSNVSTTIYNENILTLGPILSSFNNELFRVTSGNLLLNPNDLKVFVVYGINENSTNVKISSINVQPNTL